MQAVEGCEWDENVKVGAAGVETVYLLQYYYNIPYVDMYNMDPEFCSTYPPPL